LLLVIDSSGSVVISKPKATWTATLGLVVHAAADGIALGKETCSYLIVCSDLIPSYQTLRTDFQYN
jgi:hypothetical protein